MTRTLFLCLGLLTLLAPGCDSGTSHGPGVGPPSGSTQSTITGPNGQPDDHGNDIQNATFITGAATGAPPVTGSGSIDYVLDVDVFELFLNQGTYDFSTVTTGDTSLALLDANGNLIAQNDDEDLAQGKLNSFIEGRNINPNPLPAGIYYLAVGEGSAAQGTLPIYQVQVQ